ncbi:MAG: hypothetical protein M1826_000203 [Phylliscum demangeonii]|nr:MAG: hypothetical protein M1826_000203 [Phylliscum demangeonii]
MVFFFRHAVALAAMAASLVGRAVAGPASSAFVLANAASSQNLTFALNVPNNASADDMFFYLSGPVSNSYIAVGIGSEMAGALMFIAYPGADGRKAVLSPRIATDEIEPVYTSDVQVDVLDGSGVSGGILTVMGHCHHCRTWKGGKLDFQSTTQPWIYAIGHDDGLHSDSVTARLRQHVKFGDFSLDMRQATGEPGVPNAANVTAAAAARDGNQGADSATRTMHALFMLFVFVIMFPVGALFLRLFGMVRAHMLTQLGGVLIVIVGSALGIKLSTVYDKSKNFRSGHQIIGLVVLCVIISQAALGLIHHRLYLKNHDQRKSPIRWAHRIIGPLVILLGIVNGGIGFDFANSSRSRIVIYVIIVVLLNLVFAAMIFVRVRWNRRKSAQRNPHHGGLPAPNPGEGPHQGFQHSQPAGALPLSTLQSGITDAAAPPLYYPPPPGQPKTR